MPAASSDDSTEISLPPAKAAPAGLRGVVVWSSFFFALLQSICGFFLALSSLRLAIGITSLALGAGATTLLQRLHGDWIRRPMVAVALIGSVLNLVILIQIRYLRKRPASQWRQRPPSHRQLVMERVQLVLSIATLVLLAIEEYLHFGFHQTL